MSDDRVSPNPDETEAPPAGEAPTQEREATFSQQFVTLLLASSGVTLVLALVLFVAFGAFGASGAPYWAVGAAVIGGIVMRRMLLDEPPAARVLLFTAGTIGGALLGLWLGGLLLPVLS